MNIGRYLVLFCLAQFWCACPGTKPAASKFERTALPADLNPMYDEAAAFKAKTPGDKGGKTVLDVGFMTKNLKTDSAVIVPFDKDAFYQPMRVPIAKDRIEADLPLDREFLVILDLGETARNNYQAFSQLASARELIPEGFRPRLCDQILCAAEPFDLGEIGGRIPGLDDLPLDIGGILPPVKVGPVGTPPKNICERCFEKGPSIVPCLVWRWCGEFPIKRSIYVRRNIYNLTPAQVDVYRTGVAAMKALPDTVPTSWWYQARMHALNAGTAAALQDQCQHRQFLFFSWHRMYVYFFERILRKASGDNTFALPYWNYTDIAGQGALPEGFRTPANGGNALYNGSRQAIYNGGAALPPADVDYSAGFSLTNFTAATGGTPSFGGRTVTAPGHFPPGAGSGRIEQSPHNNVHNDISGDMGGGESPRDPIFWLHHANIDRLWKRWLALGNGRANPTGDTFWMTHVFNFFDENGAQVSLTGAQILNTVTQLNYRYDDDPLVLWELLRDRNFIMASQLRFKQAETLASIKRPVRLADKRVDARMPMPKQALSGLRESMQADVKKDRVILQLKNIRYDEPVGVTYLLFLNLPAQDSKPDHTHPNFIGTLGFFGGAEHQHHGPKEEVGVVEEYDITRVIRKIGATDSLVVTAMPSLPVIPADRKDLQELASKLRAKGNPRFDEIMLLRVQAE